jgi:phage terminase large subunit-like protein
MVTGMGAREHPLLLQITTAGFNLASPCYDQETEARKVLEGAIDNPELFGIIYTIDDGDEWTNPASLRKANPNYDVSVSGEFLESQLRQAIQNPIAQNKFKTKHLNVWCSARSAWINLQEWLAAARPDMRREDFAGERCVISLDIASKCDLLAETELYTRVIEGKQHYYWFSRYWLPENTVAEAGKNAAIYAKWVSTGKLNVTEGATIDYMTIASDVARGVVASNAEELVFDPFNAIALVQQVVAADGVRQDMPLVEFVQKPWNFSVPMDEITSALKDGRLHHDGHPITTWCMSNVVARPGKKGMYSPGKETSDAKIDGAVSGIMAISRLMPSGAAERGTIDGWLHDQL